MLADRIKPNFRIAESGAYVRPREALILSQITIGGQSLYEKRTLGGFQERCRAEVVDDEEIRSDSNQGGENALQDEDLRPACFAADAVHERDTIG